MMNSFCNVPHVCLLEEPEVTASHVNGSRSAQFDDKNSMEEMLSEIILPPSVPPNVRPLEPEVTASHVNGSRSTQFGDKNSMGEMLSEIILPPYVPPNVCPLEPKVTACEW